MLLIDELDRTDEPFEAFLLELLSDFQVTIPELGVIKAAEPPIVVITSNRTREIHDALKRRCFYYWVDYPNAERELEILRARLPAASLDLSREVVGFVQKLRGRDLFKLPGVAETIDWTDALVAARPGGADARRDRPFARRPAQIPGRHRAHPRHARPPRSWKKCARRWPPRGADAWPSLEPTRTPMPICAADSPRTSCSSRAPCAPPACRSGPARRSTPSRR